MIRPWWRWHRRERHDPEIKRMKEQAAQDLREARLRAIRAVTVGNEIDAHRKENHLAALFWSALGGDRHDRL